MTDERFVAQQTERERKSMANSARKRKTHNGKGGCNLPHERLTRKELMAMNGEIEKVDLSKPMSWKEFKALSSTLQEAYIYQLVKKYDISCNLFSQMVRRNPGTVSPYMKEHPELKKLFNSSAGRTLERRAKNQAFMEWAGLIPDESKEEERTQIEVPECKEAIKAEATRAIFGPMPWEGSKKIELTQNELDLMLLRQKVEIYERIIFGGAVND